MSAAPSAAMASIKSILVATDLSHGSEKPLRYATAIARDYSAKLSLMHVVPSLESTLVGPDDVAEAAETAWNDAEQIEHKLVSEGGLTGLDHQVIIRNGDIWIELEKVIKQEQIDMVVIGTHSHKGLVKLVLGSIAEQIFRHASCPVVTIGPHTPERAVTDGPLLFATDFGEGSKRALPYAISLANKRRAELVLLHVLSLAPDLKGDGWYTPADIAQIQEEEQAATRKRLKELVEHAGSGVEFGFMAEFGEPGEGILQAAEVLRAEAIIMGLNRTAHADMISHLPWSTAYKIVCRAGCPVLTVRS